MNRLTWGDTVQVSQSAPRQFRPGEFGEICGFHEHIDQTIYTVEFADGIALEIPDQFLSNIDISN